MVSPVLTPWLAERVGWESALSLTPGLTVVTGLLRLVVRTGSSDGWAGRIHPGQAAHFTPATAIVYGPLALKSQRLCTAWSQAHV